ncbi:MAG: EamA family transporter [Bacteroidales bacterium]|nr:EamA family transporter [Bacteroidales bacterium]
MIEKSTQGLHSWLILFTLVLVWGSSFILIKKSLLYFSALEVGLLRIIITFIFLFPMALKKIRKVSRRQKYHLLISGVVGSLIPSCLFAFAQSGIDSSLAGSLNSLTPLFTLLLGLMFFSLRTRWYNIIGVFIGLVGALGLIYVSGSSGFAFNFRYAFLVILATICYAFNVNFIKTFLKNLDSITITVLTFYFIGFPALLFLLFFSDIADKLLHQKAAWTGMGYLSILSIVGTGLALIIFNKLIKVTTPVFASSVTYLIPVVAILWGIVDGEVFKPAYALWFLLILFGVFLVNAKPHHRMNISSVVLFWKKK